jgi:prepilin-type N-terminal cleavage/methylation domain-containing protein
MKLNKMAFTLIELLVAVLIIGILAAIALPQYQKAVWKSRAAQLQQSVRDLSNAQEMYFLVHGRYPTNFDELDISFDSLPNKPAAPISYRWSVPSANAVRANDNMELIINTDETYPASYLHIFSTGLFHKGKYSAAGFEYVHDSTGSHAALGKRRLYCFEHSATLPTQGDFCNKVMGISSTPVIINGNYRYFPVN